MERRNFLQFGLAGISVGMAAPLTALAETAKIPVTADLIYSEQSQGRWAGKAATHLPTIELDKTGGKTTVNVVTAHEMKAYEHYIVKHVLLDKDFKFIAEHFFNPLEDKVARSVFTLENYQGTLYALSFCNKHDLWLSATEV